MRRTRCPSTARIRMLASSTRALLGIPLLFAAGATDLLVLLHELVFRRAPRRDHGIEFLSRRPHGVHLGLAALLLGWNIEAEGLAMPSDGKGLSGLQIAREVLAKLAHADLFGFHYCVPCVHNSIFRTCDQGWKGPQRAGTANRARRRGPNRLRNAPLAAVPCAERRGEISTADGRYEHIRAGWCVRRDSRVAAASVR